MPRLDIRNDQWKAGYAAAMALLYDIFDSRSDALYRSGLRRRDIDMILAVIRAAIVARDRLAEVGARNMQLAVYKSGKAEFLEKDNVKK